MYIRVVLYETKSLVGRGLAYCATYDLFTWLSTKKTEQLHLMVYATSAFLLRIFNQSVTPLTSLIIMCHLSCSLLFDIFHREVEYCLSQLLQLALLFHQFNQASHLDLVSMTTPLDVMRVQHRKNKNVRWWQFSNCPCQHILDFWKQEPAILEETTTRNTFDTFPNRHLKITNITSSSSFCEN